MLILPYFADVEHFTVEQRLPFEVVQTQNSVLGDF
jgi:hypothetical protein